MAVTKSVEIDGKEVTFRASAAIPRLYRNKFHRDIYKDLNELQKGIDENDPENSNLDTFSLELFENIAWLMVWEDHHNRRTRISFHKRGHRKGLRVCFPAVLRFL